MPIEPMPEPRKPDWIGRIIVAIIVITCVVITVRVILGVPL